MENAIETKGVYKIAREIAEEKGLNPNILKGMDDNLSVDEYMIQFVFEALKKLSLLKIMFHNEDLSELNGYELDGAVLVIDEVFDLIDATGNLYSQTH